MPQFKCPQCSTVINAQPGEEANCLNCGFRATVPAGAGAPIAAQAPAGPSPLAAPPPVPVVAPTPSPAPSAPAMQGPPPLPMGEVQPLAKSTAAWGFLLAMVGLGTFFLAPTGIPFLFGLGGIALGVVAFVKNRKDRRGLIACVLGAVAILAGVIYIVAY